MDALSTIASLIAVGQALAAIPGIIDILRSIAQTRQELLQLVNDVELLNSLGILIRETIDNLDDDSKAKFRIPQLSENLIDRVRTDLASIVTELEELAHKCQPQRGQGNTQAKVSKFKWFKHKKQVTSLSQKASKNCADLQTILNLTSFLTLTSHGKMIIDIHTVTMSQARSHTTQLSPLLVPSQPRYISDVSSHAVDTNNIQDAPKGGVITKFQGHDQSNLQSIIGEAIRQPFPGGKTTEESQIQLIATLRRGCARDCQCQCQCHSPPPRTRPHPAISPIRRWLDSAYNIIPRFGTQRCNVYTCQRGYSPVHVNFRIPLWFCSRTLEASLSFSSVVGVGASLHLHVARMFSNYNISWEIHENKIEWVRLRLFRREISPIDHDAYSKPGYLIHRAILSWQFKVVELLLQEAASILSGTDIGKNLATIARYVLYILRDPRHTEYGKYILRKVIALDEDVDDNWPLLHKTVQEGGDLAAILEDSSEDTNLIDKFGQTPLHYAVINNDIDAIQCLLSHGADPNIVSAYNGTPLIYAAFYGYYDCMYALINGKCDINKVPEDRSSAFKNLITSKKEGSAEMVNFFIKNGAALSHDPVDGRSALHILAQNPSAAEIEEKFKLLVRAGYELGAKDIYGNTSLDDTVRYNNAPMLRLLMCAGCKLDETPEPLNSLLLAILCCEAATLGIIDEAEFTMDVRWRDEEGDTAFDVFNWRMYTSLLPGNFQRPSDDDIEAFRKLLGGVRDRYLSTEIQTLELVVKHLREHSYTLAREALNHIIEEKVKWNIPAEYRTFRAVDVQIKEEMIEAAIESLEEFMEVSRSRVGTDPFVGDYCRVKGLKDQGLIVKDIN